ncbi:PEP/pyruvate-binding domain-containing protein [Geodermatophilus sp. SYSU D00742]
MTAGPVPLAAVEDEGTYGGKAVALGRALRSGLPVPPGTALPVDLVATVAAGDREAAAAVRDAAAQLGGPLAVRSSAVGEDGGTSSYAGQHLSVLNVGTADVVDAVVRVAASACAEPALAYRRARGDRSPPRCAVVLQRLVPAVAAGVLFSHDPVTGADQLVVEASWSLGEAVVGGMVVPDLFRLDRDGRLLDRVVGRKDRAVVPRPGGGTATVDVEPQRARQPCLHQAELTVLADLAHRCDELFGGPSDVEWAWGAAGVALLQRRPITTG